MTVPNVYEIFKKFEEAPTLEDKKDALRNNAYFYLKDVLKYTFDEKYQFYAEDKFPEDYMKPDTLPGIRLAGIESEIRKIYLFTVGDATADSLTPQKRHVLLLQLLESFEPLEAQIWFNMLKKDLQIPHLTKELVQEVFPEIFS